MFRPNDFGFAPPLIPGTRQLRTIPHSRARRAGLVPWVAQEGWGGGGRGIGWLQVELNHTLAQAINPELFFWWLVFHHFMYGTITLHQVSLWGNAHSFERDEPGCLSSHLGFWFPFGIVYNRKPLLLSDMILFRAACEEINRWVAFLICNF